MRFNQKIEAKMNEWKTIELIQGILSSRKRLFNSIESDDNNWITELKKLQSESSLSISSFYERVFTHIIFKIENECKSPKNKFNKDRISFDLINKLNEGFLSPLLLELKKEPLNTRLEILFWFSKTYDFFLLLKTWDLSISNYYKWETFNKWTTLEVTFSYFFDEWAKDLFFRKSSVGFNTWWLLSFNEIELLKWRDLNKFWLWITTVLKWFFANIDNMAYEKWRTNEELLDKFLRYDEIWDTNYISTVTSYLFSKWVFTMENFKENWFYDNIKNMCPGHSLKKLKLINIFVKWARKT
jgi:hypothetical protein